MYEEEYVLEAVVYMLTGWMGFEYSEQFLHRKYENRRKAMLLWLAAYLAGQILYERFIEAYPLYDRFTHIVPYLILLPLLQYFFFERNLPRQAFVIASFVAGWEILRFAVSPLAHAILSLWSPFWGWLLETLAAKDIMDIESLTENMVILNRAAIFLILGICRGLQLGIFYLYLRLIGKYFIGMDNDWKAQESWYLLTPCITVLCIDLTMRLMAYSVDNSALMIIYDRVPETLVLLPVMSILLLGIVVSSVILFRGIVQFKDEERKRMMLENRIVDVHRQIEDLQDIYGDIRGLRHDLRNHIANLASYMRNRSMDHDRELDSYLDGMETTVARLDFTDRTGSPMLDVILHQIRQQAKRKNISFLVDFHHYPENAPFDVYDISVILNNALQNAVEACEKISGERIIELRSYEKGSLFFLEIENDFDGKLIWENDDDLPSTTKAVKQMHGLGLDNIRRCARKYRGDVEIRTEERGNRNVFQMTVMLYRKEKEGKFQGQ